MPKATKIESVQPWSLPPVIALDCFFVNYFTSLKVEVLLSAAETVTAQGTIDCNVLDLDVDRTTTRRCAVVTSKAHRVTIATEMHTCFSSEQSASVHEECCYPMMREFFHETTGLFVARFAACSILSIHVAGMIRTHYRHEQQFPRRSAVCRVSHWYRKELPEATRRKRQSPTQARLGRA